jgi:hypothetical protein
MEERRSSMAGDVHTKVVKGPGGKGLKVLAGLFTNRWFRREKRNIMGFLKSLDDHALKTGIN